MLVKQTSEKKIKNRVQGESKLFFMKNIQYTKMKVTDKIL